MKHVVLVFYDTPFRRGTPDPCYDVVGVFDSYEECEQWRKEFFPREDIIRTQSVPFLLKQEAEQERECRD